MSKLTITQHKILALLKPGIGMNTHQIVCATGNWFSTVSSNLDDLVAKELLTVTLGKNRSFHVYAATGKELPPEPAPKRPRPVVMDESMTEADLTHRGRIP